MSEACYATTEDLKVYAFQMGRGDDLRHEAVVLRASRIIDQLCGVEPGYFAVAGPNVTEREILGDGTSLLRLPPYVRGSLASAEYIQFWDTPEYVEILDRNGVQWLKALGGRYWRDCAPVEITARWGWDAVPEDIVEATIELAIAMWRQRDAAFLRVAADVNGQGGISGQALPERVKIICQAWKRKLAPVFA
jgi:hypothetical protein